MLPSINVSQCVLKRHPVAHANKSNSKEKGRLGGSFYALLHPTQPDVVAYLPTTTGLRVVSVNVALSWSVSRIGNDPSE